MKIKEIVEKAMEDGGWNDKFEHFNETWKVEKGALREAIKSTIDMTAKETAKAIFRELDELTFTPTDEKDFKVKYKDSEFYIDIKKEWLK